MTDNDVLTRLLAGTCPDPDGNGMLTIATKKLVIAPSLRGDEGECVDGLPLGRSLAVVSDAMTHEVMGARVERSLAGRGKVVSIVLPGRPHADEETVRRIEQSTTAADALVAVGSGTINDICKYTSARAGKPYVVYATAPSMNGYVSMNAAITVHGHKKSLPAHAPLGVFLDLGVLAAAPRRMICAGLGDSLCRSTAQADWLLAHLLLGQSYRVMPFVLLEWDEAALFGQSEALLRGDLAAMDSLVRVLLLSGFGTAICGSSHPASQGEHLISHYADMMADPTWPQSFHGEQIGVTTLTMARLQERMLAEGAPTVVPDTVDAVALTEEFGTELAPSCWAEFSQKRLDRRKAEAVNDVLRSRWGKIRDEIARVSLPADYLEQVLRRAGAPTTPEVLSWPQPFYRRAVNNARLIRNRYTFLDLAANSAAPMNASSRLFS